MKYVVGFLKSIAAEVLIIFAFILTINNFIGNEETIIRSDGLGYYEYLPALFIHHDLIRKDLPNNSDESIYRRINEIDAYVSYKSYKLNKYPVGPALLQWPFFAYAYWNTEPDQAIDGYQIPFQRAIFHAAIFYLFLGLFFFKRLLGLYEIDQWIIVWLQVLLVFATSIAHYAHYDAAYSHVYSFFALTAFFYCAKYYFTHLNIRHFIGASFLFGLIITLRQINVLAVLFIPFLVNDTRQLLQGIDWIKKHLSSVFLGMILAVSVFSIQCLAWYAQTGDFLVYSYQGEGFNFLKPHFIESLFGYRTGLFVYMPILFLSLISITWYLFKKDFYHFFSWTLFFLALGYIFSSWWAWDYGSSFGMRVYVDYLSCFLIPLAVFMQSNQWKWKILFIVISMVLIPINIIQTYQYKEFILHWNEMNEFKYWKIFLRTDNQFKGLLWKNHYDYKKFNVIKEFNIDEVNIEKGEGKLLFDLRSSQIENFLSTHQIHLSLETNFHDSLDAKVVVVVQELESQEFNYWMENHLLHFEEEGFNTSHRGWYDYVLMPLKDDKERIIRVGISAESHDLYLKNIRLTFLSRK